tara:strand:- start:375 stop:1295 length:921 start_codon:yes stop_codon:yes gene_type:complete
MSDALKMVKEHFGEDAIIVSSQKAEMGLGVQVTAAIDTESEAPIELNDNVSNRPSDVDEKLSIILSGQGVLPKITDKILNVCSTLGLDDIDTSLASSIDQIINFKPLPKANENETFMLVGLPGAGKTVTTAKLATKAVMTGNKINIISTDNVRAGGIQQLEAFTKILKIDLMCAKDGYSLKEAIAAGTPQCQTIIDCAGGNPFKKSDYMRQKDLISSTEAKVIMLLADGTDPLEAADLAQAYSELGAEGLIGTRTDLAKRHGSLITAAVSGNLNVYGMGIGPSVTDGLEQLNPVSLARLLLSDKTK